MRIDVIAENEIRSAVQATDTHYKRELSTLVLHAAHEPLGRAQAAKLLDLDVAGAQVYRILQSGIDVGLLERKGAARATTYGITAQLRHHLLAQYLQRPKESRAPCSYNQEWLDSYEPNQTRLLSQAARAKLADFARNARSGIGPITPYAAHEFLLDISFASSRLEGNRYSLAETRDLIENGIVPTHATADETRMVLNHHHAAKYIVNQTIGIDSGRPRSALEISTMTVREIHALLSNGLLKRDDLCGAVRDHPVEISHSTYCPPRSDHEIRPIFDAICRKAADIRDPYEQAFFVLANLPYLQPFSDCNKRTARLASNVPLLNAGLPPISWLGIDEDRYIDAILSVYELQETAALEDLFVEMVIQSGERLAMQMRAGPARQRIQARYAHELSEAVRAHILENRPFEKLQAPSDMGPRDRMIFITMVRDAVRVVLTNPLMGAEHEIKARDVMQSQAYHAMCTGESLGAMRARIRQSQKG